MTKNSIIIIGAGLLQLNQIKWASELGLNVIVTDKNDKAYGIKLANVFFETNAIDANKIISLTNQFKNEFKIIGCYSGSDFGLKTVAKISKNFNLNHCSIKSIKLSLDKFRSKSIWKQSKINTPEFAYAKSFSDFKKILKKFGFPVIVKPIDSSGSRGINSIWDEDDIKLTYKNAKRFAKSIIVEKILFGHHIDVNGLFLNGKFIQCGVFDRFFSDIPFHYPIWGCQPSSLTKIQERKVYLLLEQAARSLGIETGPVKGDIIYTKNGPYIIEIAPRFHGDVSTSYITPFSTGQNPIKTWFSFLNSDKYPQKYMKKTKNSFAGWMAIFPQKEGTLKSITGIKQAKKSTGVIDISIIAKKGDLLTTPKDNLSLCGFIWARGKTQKQLHRNLLLALSKIHLKVEPLLL